MEVISLDVSQSSGYPALQPVRAASYKGGYDWILTSSLYAPRMRDVYGNAMAFTGWLPSTGLEQVILVRRTVTITSAAAVTPVVVVADSEVPAGYTFFLTGFLGRVNGTTVWATTATVKLQDTNGTPVDLVTFAVAAMTSQARIVPGTASVTLEDAYSLGTGTTAAKGIQLVGDANGTGSNFVLTVHGYLKRTT